MVRDRAIVHINIADFAAGVETCLAPSLKHTPIIIAPEGAPRARVFDMNELAFREGIRKGMPLAKAQRLHPKIPVLPPRLRHYHTAMTAALKQAAAFTPKIEAGSADGHLFLDITGTSRLHGPPPDVAWRLHKAIDKHLGLRSIWTLATNKLVAKTASRVVKPTGEYIVGPGEESAFLAPLPLILLPGLTREECRILARLNIALISQARQLTRPQLAVPFDNRAGHIHDLLLGIDTSPVGRDPRGNRQNALSGKAAGQKIRAEHEFADDTNDAGMLKAGLALMAADICRELRRAGRRAATLDIGLTYSDTLAATRSTVVDTDCDTTLLKQAWDLLEAAWARRVRIRHISLACTSRLPAPSQALLFNTEGIGAGLPAAGLTDTGGSDTPSPAASPARSRQLLRAMDTIRARFGDLAVQSGAALGLGPLAAQAAQAGGSRA